MPRPSKQVFVALIGDVVASRALKSKDRAALQSHLRAWILELNAELGPGVLAAPLTLTAGDEIQGLFRKPMAVVQVVQEITDRLFGVPVQPDAVFGAGRGTLTTGRVPPPPQQEINPAWLDGPSFHRARSALEQAQRQRQWASFQGFGETQDEVLNALFCLMGVIRGRWTANQAMLSYASRNTRRQKDLAERIGISPSVVSEALKAAQHQALLAGERASRRLLEELATGELDT